MSNQFSFLYSLHSYVANNENSDDSNVEKSSIKIEDNNEDILTFNLKTFNENGNNKYNNDIEKNRKNESFNEGNSIDNENQDEYIKLKKNLFQIENENSSEIDIINDEKNTNNNKYNNKSKKILISDEKKIDNKNELQTKSNENILTEQTLLKKNISSTNISPSQSIIKGKNIINLFNSSSSDKENIPFIFNLNTSDKISCNSLLESNNKTLTNKSSKSQKFGNENDYIFTEPHRLSMYNVSNLLNIKINNNKVKNDSNQNNKINLKNNINNNFLFINKSNINNINNSLKNNNVSNKGNNKIENEINSHNRELNDMNGNSLLEWLSDIDLSNYYNLFINKGIYSFDKIINDIKNEKFRIQKSDFEEIGIEKNGHIYRIITKLEIDSECIDKQIYQILTSSNINQGRNLITSNEYCFGCCTLKENNNDNEEMIYNLDNWLNSNNLNHLKENFICNGFDKIEFFIIQMFSSYPINDNILKNELKINNEKDRDIILFKLNRDIKRILQKLKNQDNIEKKYKLQFFGEDDEEEICFIF